MDRQLGNGQREHDANAGAGAKPDGRGWASNVMARAIIHVVSGDGATTYSYASGVYRLRDMHALASASDAHAHEHAHGDGDADGGASGDDVHRGDGDAGATGDG